jgi:hypothetical protein
MRPDVWRLLLLSLSGLILANVLKSSDWKSLALNIELFLDGHSRLVMKCFLEYSYRSLFQRKAVKLDFLSIMLINKKRIPISCPLCLVYSVCTKGAL